MSVNPDKVRKVLVVHGVQTGKNKDQQQHRIIQDLINSRLGNIPLKFQAEMYRYEDLNDAVRKKYLESKPEQGWVIRDRVVDTGKMQMIARLSCSK